MYFELHCHVFFGFVSRYLLCLYNLGVGFIIANNPNIITTQNRAHRRPDVTII